MADVGSSGDFSECGTLGSFGQAGSSEVGNSTQPTLCEDSLTLDQKKADLDAKRNKMELSCLCYSRAGRPNPVLVSNSEKSSWIFTEEKLTRAPFAKLFATGPKDPLHNKPCFFSMLYKKTVKMPSRRFWELE